MLINICFFFRAWGSFLWLNLLKYKRNKIYYAIRFPSDNIYNIKVAWHFFPFLFNQFEWFLDKNLTKMSWNDFFQTIFMEWWLEMHIYCKILLPFDNELYLYWLEILLFYGNFMKVLCHKTQEKNNIWTLAKRKKNTSSTTDRYYYSEFK